MYVEAPSPSAVGSVDVVSVCGAATESHCSTRSSVSPADGVSSSSSETLLAMEVRSTRDKLASGEVRPDWKGGWNTLTEYLQTEIRS